MTPQTLAQLLHQQGERNGQRVAIAKVTGSGRAENLTYAQLLSRASRLAGWLQHEVGLTTGDRVAVLLDNHSVHEFFTSLGACWLGGYIAVPMNARLAPPEVAYQLEHCDARVLITTTTFADCVTTAAVDASLALSQIVVVGEGDDAEWPTAAISLSEALLPDHRLTLVEPGPDTLCDLIYTSGTTGLPKGALFDNRSVIALGQLLSKGFRIEPGQRLLSAVPVFTSTGIHTFPMPMLTAGGTMLFETEFDPRAWVARATTLTPDIYFGVPAMLALILEHNTDDDLRRVTSLQSIMFGGSPMPLSLAERLVDILPGVGLWNLYGLTEGGPGGAALRPEDALLHLETVGTSMVGMEVRIVDDARKEVPRGSAGEIAVLTPSRMREYLDRPDATAQAIDADGWLYTGDVGSMDDDGFVRILDRKKDMIVRGGFNVYPAEVEAALVSHPEVVEAAVIGKPHSILGEDVQASVVLQEDSTLTSDDVIDYASTRLADYKVPRDVRIVPALPRNAMGKLLRRKLRAPESWATQHR